MVGFRGVQRHLEGFGVDLKKDVPLFDFFPFLKQTLLQYSLDACPHLHLAGTVNTAAISTNLLGISQLHLGDGDGRWRTLHSCLTLVGVTGGQEKNEGDQDGGQKGGTLRTESEHTVTPNRKTKKHDRYCGYKGVRFKRIVVWNNPTMLAYMHGCL